MACLCVIQCCIECIDCCVWWQVPSKSRAHVSLELARLEEYYGNISRARELLREARAHSKQDWKVFLESVLLERRVGCREAAVRD